MNISRTFIERPIFAGVLSAAIFIAGLIAIYLLPVSEYPEVVPPSVVVTATYPGASPQVIAETVAAPLEEQINGVENMLYMSSMATTDGVLQLTVTFKIGTNPDLAESQVQNRVQRALPRLPMEVRAYGVITKKQSPNLTMVVHLISTDNRYDELYLRNYAVLNLRDDLRRLQGMGDVVVFGGGVEIAHHGTGGFPRRGIAAVCHQVWLQAGERLALLFNTGVAGRQHVEWRLRPGGRAGKTGKGQGVAHAVHVKGKPRPCAGSSSSGRCLRLKKPDLVLLPALPTLYGGCSGKP